MTLNINEKDYQKIDTPNSPANNFDFEISLLCQKHKVSFPQWKVWTNKKHTNLFIEFVGENRVSIDKLELFLEMLKKNYTFTHNFVNPSTHELTERFQSLTNGRVGTLFIQNIKYV